MIDPETKKWIDESSYESLLEQWRNAPAGSPLFVGDTGVYYAEVMARKRNEVGPGEAVRASKNVGWSGGNP